MRNSDKFSKDRPHLEKLKICHMNVRSLSKQIDQLQILFSNRQYHIIGITESWLKSHHTNKSVNLEGYKIMRQDRAGRGGGGVAFYIKKELYGVFKPKIISRGSSSNLDHLFIKCQVGVFVVAIGVGYMYRRGLPFHDLESVLSLVSEDHSKIILMGDFNVDFLSSTESRHLKNILSFFNLTTPQSMPTRIHDNGGSLIDLIVTNLPFNIHNFHQHPGVADHELIAGIFNIGIQHLTEYITFRNFRNLEVDSLQQNIDNFDLTRLTECIDIDAKIDLVNSELHKWMDQHIPFTTRRIKTNQPQWLTNRIKNIIQIRDMSYRAWKHNRSSENKTTLKTYDKKVKGMIKGAIKSYIASRFDPGLSTKELWSNLNKEGIGKDRGDNQVIHFSVSELNSSFAYPSSTNTQSIGGFPNSTNAGLHRNSVPQSNDPVNGRFFDFIEINDDLVLKAIMSLNSGAVGPDGIPIKFIKLCSPAILPILTHIFNSIIRVKKYPSAWKISKVIPIPKSSDPKSLEDYRPISLLSSISKIFEKLIMSQIKEYLQVNQLLSKFQSGFRESHSTVTLLSNVTDLIRSKLDNQRLLALVLLDFSKAFNSINFDILKFKLYSQFNFSNDSIQLLMSYLTDRYQYVVSSNQKSSLLPLWAGVPQGSILGPVIFAMYINDISSLPLNSGVHIFADDVQIYKEIDDSSPLSRDTGIDLINQDLISINDWAIHNELKLNSAKSQAIIFGKKINYLHFKQVKIHNVTIPFSESVRNLGLVMSNDLSWDKHINLICQRMYNALRLLNGRREGTPRDTRLLLVRTLVLSHLLYCDVIFSNLKSNLMLKVTRVFNGCVRYIYGLRRFDHISDFVNKIYGMPLKSYLNYRLGLFIFKSLHEVNFPLYIKATYKFSNSSRTNVLILHTHNTNYMKDSLLVRGANIWNALPRMIRDAESVNKFKTLSLEYFASL